MRTGGSLQSAGACRLGYECPVPRGHPNRVRVYLRLRARVTPASTLTCLRCGTAKAETMPTDACQFFYECTGCGELLRPKPGNCCVFCSMAPCRVRPSKQARPLHAEPTERTSRPAFDVLIAGMSSPYYDSLAVLGCVR